MLVEASTSTREGPPPGGAPSIDPVTAATVDCRSAVGPRVLGRSRLALAPCGHPRGSSSTFSRGFGTRNRPSARTITTNCPHGVP